MEPCSNLIFSNLRKNSKSLIQCAKVGEYASFHLNEFRRLASRVAKATQSASVLDNPRDLEEYQRWLLKDKEQ